MIKKRISISIGQYHASRSPVIIQTLLGSCVAVCLFDSKTRIGGMNHIFLPGKADLNCFNQPARYGINAMELLINAILELGADRRRLSAKVFGGGHLLPSIPPERGTGGKIAAFVISFLEKEHIPIISQDTGGTVGRKIFFHTNTGEVFLKRIAPMKNSLIVPGESEAFKRLTKEARKPGEVTLFGPN